MALDILVNATSATVTSGGTTAPAAGTVEQWTVTQTGWPSVPSPTLQTRLLDKADEGKTSGYELMLLQNIAATSLTAALASGTAYTALSVGALPQAMDSGDTLVLGVGATTQNVVLSAAASAGATSLAVTSFTASANFAIGTSVTDLTTAGANLNGSVWTVERGGEGTTPYAHAANWVCVPSLTAGSLHGGVGPFINPVLPVYIQQAAYVLPFNYKSGGASNTTLGQLQASSFAVADAVTLVELAVNVGTAVASSTYRVGVYADNGAYYPGKLLVDAGLASGAATGEQDLTVSVALAPGVYWFAGVCQGVAPSLYGMVPILPALPFADANSNAGYLWNGGSLGGLSATYMASGVTGALPSLFPPGQSLSNANTNLIIGKVQ